MTGKSGSPAPEGGARQAKNALEVKNTRQVNNARQVKKNRENREKYTSPVQLSGRLESIAGLAGRGNTVCDVGCDHAHIPIRLLQTGAFAQAIGMDVLDGPLGKAAGNLDLYGMADRVDLRLSDGLDAYEAGEADTVVITGMGGTLMREILLREPEKTRSIPALVLGPQSDPDKVRDALRGLGFVIEDERLIFEDGKYYPVLRAVSGGKRTAGRPKGPGGAGEDPEALDLFPAGIPEQIRREAEDLFGPVLLSRRDPLLKEFLTRRIAVLERIRGSVSEAAASRGQDLAAEAAVPAENGQEPPAEAVAPAETGQEPAVEQESSAADRRSSGALREKHLQKLREIDHSLVLYRAALAVYREE